MRSTGTCLDRKSLGLEGRWKNPVMCPGAKALAFWLGMVTIVVVLVLGFGRCETVLLQRDGNTVPR